jgi:NAD(P)H-dependent FMN reductase
MESKRIAGVSGSLRDTSCTRVAVRTALRAAETEGAETNHIDLRGYDLPVFDPDVDVEDGSRLRREIRGADAVVLGTPMYHGSYASPLKNALDYCGFDEFEDKTVGLLAVSGGRFPVTALEHLRSTCRALNAWVIPHQAAVPNSSAAFENGELVDDGTRERVEKLGRDVVKFAGVGDCENFEGDENVGAD